MWGGVAPLTASVVLLSLLWAAPGNNLTPETERHLSSGSPGGWVPAAGPGPPTLPPSYLHSRILLPGTHWAPEEQET